MKKNFKWLIIIILVFCIFLISCTKAKTIVPSEAKDTENTPTEVTPKTQTKEPTVIPTPTVTETIPPHEHIESDWIFPEGSKCEDIVTATKICTICGEVLVTEEDYFIDHDMEVTIIQPTCTVDGKEIYQCKNCDFHYSKTIYATGHEKSDYIVKKYPTYDEPGIKQIVCLKCGEVLEEYKFVKNGYLDHGKLSVDGTDLVDMYGEKYQLYGLSYHGLQWFGRYVNRDTIIALQNHFGINVIRLACYSSEGGYAEGGEGMKKLYKKYIDEAITTAAEIGLYVVVDWHMVGATVAGDKNPLYYLDDAKEFFEYVASTYKDYDNVLYEIMNEPCGTTTWADCKEYANIIIPIIREYSDGIILVGNPKWSSDLVSVANDPLTGYDNIMYTFHFYAGDNTETNKIVTAYNKGLPIFVSEFGFMDSDGNGSMNYTSGEKWLKVLNERNISFIAWNISNSSGSASIIAHNNYTMTEFVDKNLKEWGQYLRNYYRTKSGLGE